MERNARKDRAGSAMIEVLIAMALMSTVEGALLTVGNTSPTLCETGVSNSTLEGNLRRALDRLSRELDGARADSMAALAESPLWQEAIDFDRPGAMRSDDGRVTWSSNRAELRLEPGETDDGLDNDGNGLVDEGMLVLVQPASSSSCSRTTCASTWRTSSRTGSTTTGTA